MNIEMSYAEMSFLRDLVRKKQYEIWQVKYAPYLDTNLSIEEISKIKDKVERLDEEVIACGPICEEDCCALLLSKFAKKEREIQEILIGGKE